MTVERIDFSDGPNGETVGTIILRPTVKIEAFAVTRDSKIELLCLNKEVAQEESRHLSSGHFSPQTRIEPVVVLRSADYEALQLAAYKSEQQVFDRDCRLNHLRTELAGETEEARKRGDEVERLLKELAAAKAERDMFREQRDNIARQWNDNRAEALPEVTK